MTDREKKLAFLVGLCLVLYAAHWGYNKYKDAVDAREGQIASLRDEQQRLLDKQLAGALANRQLGEYIVRSLPGDAERARSQYSKWLLDLCEENRLKNPTVDPTNSIPVANLYRKHTFRLEGNAGIDDVLNLLHDFYAKDYLHRIKTLTIKPATRAGGYDLDLGIDVMAIDSVPVDAEEPGENSWRVDSDPMVYIDPIMNRNMFNPPNKAPRFTGKPSVEAYVGRSTPVPLTFSDPEKGRITYELISAPEGLVSLDARSGTLRVLSNEKQKLDVKIRATDQGYPRMQTEQALAINVVDPPPPPAEKPPPPPPPKFDDASQTVLTGLTQGRDDWTAWMNVRTRGKTLKLKVNDEFEIGTVKGKITEINAKFVEIEVDGRRFTLTTSGVLGKAYKKSQED